MNPNRIPPPRPSGHTAVGLGAVEARNGGHVIDPREERDEAITPRSLELDVEALRGLAGDDDASRSAVDYLAGQLRALRETVTRQDGTLAATARHAHGAEQAVARLEDKAEERHKEVLTAISGVSGALGDVAAKVVDLDLQIGKEPEKVDLMRASQVGNLTAAELTQLEQGTGLKGLVGRLVAGLARAREADRALAEDLAKKLGRLAGIRAGVSAGATALATTAPGWVPHAVTLAKQIFGG